MSGKTESTSNSFKFVPMPVSALLANLGLNENQPETPNSSFTVDDNDSSFSENMAKKTVVEIPIEPNTPQFKISKDFKTFSSERKIVKDYNKENNSESLNLYRPPNKMCQSAQKLTKSSYSDLEFKNINVLVAQDVNSKTSHIKTPEKAKPSSIKKSKVATPQIKSGIRKFTPGSARQSNKKTPQLLQNRDKVKCELFRQNQQRDEDSAPIEGVPVPVPDTPINTKPMPASYAATPSYPQGKIGNNNSKILFKTTSIKNKKYMFIKKLGVGGSSEVYKVLEVGTSCEFAVKCVYLATDQDLAQGYINEVRLLRELQNSDRVIKLHDYEYDRVNKFLRLVLEVGETDLSSFLRVRGAGLPPALVLHYWEEMLLAVNYIHEHGVIHADLKPANFLLVCGRLKLIDFGIASAISSDATSVVRAQAAGTYSYISPEALMGGAGGYSNSANIKISFKSDVWSLGCILYSMIYGRTPFGHIPNLAKLAAILDPNHRIEYHPAENLPASLIHALKWCLTYNARSRPSVKELLALRHLQPTTHRPLSSSTPLPQHLLERLKQHVTAAEYTLLQQARI